MIACEAEFDIVFAPERDCTDRGLGTVKTPFELIRDQRAR
jgi:hypothetical protein